VCEHARMRGFPATGVTESSGIVDRLVEWLPARLLQGPGKFVQHLINGVETEAAHDKRNGLRISAGVRTIPVSTSSLISSNGRTAIILDCRISHAYAFCHTHG
jgi:hypothetical protein